MARNIEFTASGSCSALGNFESGDIARNVDDALAAHLVDEVGCAKYSPAVKVAEQPEKPAVKRTRKSSAAEQKED